MRELLTVAATCATCIAAEARAQDASASAGALRAGTRIRFSVARDGRVTARCDARVIATDGDTVRVAPNGTPSRPWAGCPDGAVARGDVAELSVARVDHGSRLTHTALGLFGGAVLGGVVGRVAAGSGCARGVRTCDDRGYAIGILTSVGILGGAATGAIVGLVRRAGPEWERTDPARLLFVEAPPADLYPE